MRVRVRGRIIGSGLGLFSFEGEHYSEHHELDALRLEEEVLVGRLEQRRAQAVEDVLEQLRLLRVRRLPPLEVRGRREQRQDAISLA